jgi:hypothetical protein
MNKLIKTFLIKMCQSLFEYVGNPLYKSDNVLEDSVSRIYWPTVCRPETKSASRALSLNYTIALLNTCF